jgi:phosphatidate phosphatase PAH1
VIVIYGANSEIVAAIVNAKYILGDMDGDGIITASDATIVLQAVATNTSLSGSEALSADVDKDGYITASDATMLLQVVAGIIKLNG